VADHATVTLDGPEPSREQLLRADKLAQSVVMVSLQVLNCLTSACKAWLVVCVTRTHAHRQSERETKFALIEREIE
jgi:hypothetical protein